MGVPWRKHVFFFVSNTWSFVSSCTCSRSSFEDWSWTIPNFSITSNTVEIKIMELFIKKETFFNPLTQGRVYGLFNNLEIIKNNFSFYLLDLTYQTNILWLKVLIKGLSLVQRLILHCKQNLHQFWLLISV